MVGAIGRFFSRHLYAGPSVKVADNTDHETTHLFNEVEALWNNSPLKDIELGETALRFAEYVSLHSDLPVSFETIEAWKRIWEAVLREIGHHPPQDESEFQSHDTHLRLAYRQHLRTQLHHFRNEREQLELLSELLVHFGDVMASTLSEELNCQCSDDSFQARLIDLCDDPPFAVDAIMRGIWSDEMRNAGLLEDLRERTELSALRASGIVSMPSGKPIVYPGDYRARDVDDLVETYLDATPFKALLKAHVPLGLPAEVRFEHCHIVGGTGHGKTQLLQYLIGQDLRREAPPSMVVIDSQGEMIEKIRRLDCFDPEHGTLANSLVVIDPYEVEYPPSLNLFSINRERLDQYSPAERERIFNGIVELYETFFGSLLGAELTQKQGVLFSFLARLMLEIPDATIHTLQEVMQDGERFRPYMEQLEGTARYFFEDEFFSRSFAPTKTQIARRLYGVLAIPAFERMFGAEENKIDLFELLNGGAIILISTAKDLMKTEGSALFGRFFVASLTQAILERAVIPTEQRLPVHVYIDEAQEYLDENIETLLNQARKYRCGIHLAHQHLDQLSPRLRSTLAANTSIKCVGGLSHKDAVSFGAEVGMPTENIRSLKKSSAHTEFALWVKHTTPRAIPVQVPLGFLERQDQIDDTALEQQKQNNRILYQAPVREIARTRPSKANRPPTTSRDDTPIVQEQATQVISPQQTEPIPTTKKPPAKEPPQAESTTNGAGINPKVPGRGGREHKYLQELIRNLGLEYGYRAETEAKLSAGGAVDVLLTRDGARIACEIALQTHKQYEVSNISKSLEDGVETVLVISPKPKHLDAIRTAATEALTTDEIAKVRFLSPELVPEFLQAGDVETTTVRGYKVRVSHTLPSEEEVKRRREKVAGILARTIQ